nr:rhodanese-like domain-containing protein [Actinomycetota bacterium]
MPTSRDLLAQVKAQINEIEGDEAESRLGQALVLDVREPDEHEQGAIPGALHLPRGHLEGQVEAKLADKSQPIIVHCASGFRSAFAAKTLQD